MYVYILRCRGDSLYTGYTPDPEKRYREHCEGRGAKYTRSHPPISLETVWKTETKQDALRLEYRIKKLSKAKKEQLIAGILMPEELFGIHAVRQK